MKTNFKLLLFFIGIFSINLLTSCNKEIGTNDAPDVNIVTYDDALKVAQKHTSDDQLNLKVSNEIKSSRKVNDVNGIIACYIFNFEQGFSIISGDKRLAPILAYSFDNEFPLSADSYPRGVQNWLNRIKEEIELIRKLNNEQSLIAEKLWKKYLSENDGVNFKYEPLPPPCEDIHTNRGPFLSTEWGQSVGFNDELEDMGCSADLYGQPKAGCAAVVMGQIMRYFELPSTYSWSSMHNTIGNYYSADLLKDIGVGVVMEYGCDISTTTTSKMIYSFENDFDYPIDVMSYTGSGSDLSEVLSSLYDERPVIFLGNNYGDVNQGHAWICDGFQQSFFCESLNTLVILHMNWGWYGNYDGYYTSHGFTPSTYNFNYDNSVLFIDF